MNTNHLTPETILSFCSKDPWRHSLAAPFSAGAYSYATDGKCAIRFPRRDDIPEGDKRISMSLASFMDGEGWQEIHPPAGWEKTKTTHDTCKNCDGVGNLKKCHKCNGEAVIECIHCGHEEDCKECDGIGKIPTAEGETCKACLGLGQVELPAYVTGFPSGQKTTVAMLRHIITLPDVRFYERHTSRPIRFTFDGGEGCFEPLSLR